MKEIWINDKISCIEGSEFPLSGDIGIIREGNARWLYDVGNGEDKMAALSKSCNVVLSHFHPDHIGNIGRAAAKNIYLSKETYAHLPKEVLAASCIHIVTTPICIDNLYIFTLPSSHAKGCLGLEIDGMYAFVGDALYCKTKKDSCVYNAQLLQEEIKVLKKLSAEFLLVSHWKGLVRSKTEVLAELEAIYASRTKESHEIVMEQTQKNAEKSATNG